MLNLEHPQRSTLAQNYKMYTHDVEKENYRKIMPQGWTKRAWFMWEKVNPDGKNTVSLYLWKRKKHQRGMKFCNMPCTMSQGIIDFLILLREYYYTLLVEIWCGYIGN